MTFPTNFGNFDRILAQYVARIEAQLRDEGIPQEQWDRQAIQDEAYDKTVDEVL